MLSAKNPTQDFSEERKLSKILEMVRKMRRAKKLNSDFKKSNPNLFPTKYN